MPPTGPISASSGDPIPENAAELLAAFEKGEVAQAESDAVVEAASSPETPAESPPTESVPEKVEPAWKKVLAEVPVEELFADPKLSGRLGILVQKNVKKQLADETAQRVREQKQREEDDLLVRNPAQYGQLKQAERVQEKQLATFYDQVYTPLKTTFDESESEVQEELSTRSYAHLSPADSAVAYLRDRIDIGVKVGVKKALAAAVKEAREAERKKVLAEQNGGTPRPDTGASAGSPRRSNTPASVERMSIGDYRTYGKTPAERVAAVFNGHTRSA